MASLQISRTTSGQLPSPRAGRRAHPLVFLLCAGALAASSAGAQKNLVVIDGGPDESGHVYQWTVTNRHTSPIIEIEFPHFHADLFTAPEGWRQETTFLVNIGVAEKEGVCKAIAPNPAGGIAPGRSSPFSMRVTAKGADRGVATVTVLFADGTSTSIADVALPQREAVLNQFVGLLGLGGLLGVVILVRTLRRGKGGKTVTKEDL